MKLENAIEKLKGKTQCYTISDQVATSSTEDESIQAKGNGRVEGKMGLRIYAGAELDLQIKLYIESISGARRKLVEMGGKEYIDGDDDYYEWSVSQEIDKGEKVVIVAENKSGSYAYDYRFNFSIDYAGVI